MNDRLIHCPDGTTLGHELRASLAGRLEALEAQLDYEERRREWRHANGLDGNGHGQLIPGEEDKL